MTPEERKKAQAAEANRRRSSVWRAAKSSDLDKWFGSLSLRSKEAIRAAWSQFDSQSPSGRRSGGKIITEKQ